MSTTKSNRGLTPELLLRLEQFHFRPRRAVSGPWTGMHKSPHHGASVEFSEHKEYVAGDDIRRLDWKAYAKSDRYYIKRFEQETDLSALITVEASGSMEYGGPPITKLDASSKLALAFAHILIGQSDAAGLYIRGADIKKHIPPSTQKTHLPLFTEALENASGTGDTNLTAWVEEASSLPGRASVNVFISDCLCEPDPLIKSLRTLVSMNREVLLVQVLDSDEISFPFSARMRFADMESDRKIVLDPAGIRDEYKRLMKSHIDTIRRGCAEAGVRYMLYNTERQLYSVLADFFLADSRMAGRR
ncbi:MAG: DUF58 domain-containing protein [Fibrobacteres bacterium]|nr:DUF58 domain-containing protein [Fibrobacterota bacterium]